MAEYRVASLDELELIPWRETLTGRVRHELGIGAFGVNSWVGKNVGDRVIPDHAEDQPGDHEELYVVVRGRVRFEVGDDTFDAPQGTLVFVPAGREGDQLQVRSQGLDGLALALPAPAHEEEETHPPPHLLGATCFRQPARERNGSGGASPLRSGRGWRLSASACK